MLAARAALLARLRAFFAARGVLEVETPVLARTGSVTPALQPFSARYHPPAGPPQRLFLHTSPEFAMKRLLAAGSGPIYQICKVFRDGERGRWHHPEFTLLEWYRPGWSLPQLMDEVADVLRVALQQPALPVARITYRDLFHTYLGIDPWLDPPERLRAAAIEQGISGADWLTLDGDGWLDLLLVHCLEPQLGRRALTFVYNYPPSQAALARCVRETPISATAAEHTRLVAARFEVYSDGVELANGFDELTDAAEQRARFVAEQHARARLGLDPVPFDEALLHALAEGLPSAAGVAVGLDRVLMLATGATHIDETLAFPVERA